MSYTRIVLQAVGAGLILLAVAILYYQTGLRNDIPEGVAIATLVALTGVFIMAFASQFRSVRRYRDVNHVEHVDRGYVRPARPARYERVERVDGPVESHERVETVEQRY